MEPHFSQDGRGDNRRRDDRKRDAKEQGSRSEGQRRQGQRSPVERRQFFRIVYPLTLVPKILNGKFRVISLSRQGIMLRWEGDADECPANLTLGSILSLQIQFHDGEILDLEVKITRYQSELHSHRTVYAGTLEPALSGSRISQEERYLLKHVPDFCRVAWYSSPPSDD